MAEHQQQGTGEPLALVRDALMEPRALTLQQVAEAADVPPQTLTGLFESTGRIRDAYGDEDLQYARTLSRLLELVPEDVLVRAGRVRARQLTSVVVNDLAVTRDAVLRPLLEAGIELDEIADQLAQSSQELMPLIGGLLSLDYKDILLRFLDLEAVAESGRTGSSQVDIGIGFVDLVGFTRLSATTDPSAVGEVLATFEDLVHDHVDDTDHVLIAKFIGDAAMLVCDDVDELAGALYGMVTDRRPSIEQIGRRAGLACGGVIAREGDYYGATVNLAARLTDLARPHSLVASDAVTGEISEGWEVSRIGSVQLQGLGKQRPYRLRWPSEDAPDR